MSSHKEIIMSDDNSDIEDVTDNKQSRSNGSTSSFKFNLENSNTALFKKYIEISRESLKVSHVTMQGNLIAMQSNHLAMKNVQALSEIILKQMNFNPINLKDEAKSEECTSKDESVFEDKGLKTSSSKSGIKVLSNKRLIDKKLTCIVERLPKNIQLQAVTKKDRKHENEFHCTHCQLKFKLNFMLTRHIKSCHVLEKIDDRVVTKEPKFDFPPVNNAKNEDDNKNNNNNNNDDSDICVNNPENKKDEVTPSNQHEKNFNKKCSVVLSRILSVNNNKKRQAAKNIRLLKRKITQDMKKSKESTQNLNLLNSSINKNIRFITRDVSRENLRSKKSKLPNIVGYVNTLYVNRPMRLN